MGSYPQDRPLAHRHEGLSAKGSFDDARAARAAKRTDPWLSKKPKHPERPHEPARVAASAIAEEPSGIYVVEAGDTLWRIAHEHRISVQELKDLNDLTDDLIRVGDELQVPAGDEATAEAPQAPASPETPADLEESPPGAVAAGSPIPGEETGAVEDPGS